MSLPKFDHEHERLAWARNRAGKSLGDVERMICIPKSTARDHHNGTRSIKRGIADEDLRRYARLYDVPFNWLKTGNDDAPTGFRRVDLKGTLQAGLWRSSFETDEERFVLVEDKAAWADLVLYAAEVRGDSMNRIYPDGTIVILSRRIDFPRDLEHGRRYHVVRTLPDGLTENTLKRVELRRGSIYLVPETDDPAFAPLELTETALQTINFLGKVVQAIVTE